MLRSLVGSEMCIRDSNITFKLNYTQETTKTERNWVKGEWTLLKPLLEKEDYYEPILVTGKKLDQCLHQLYKKLHKALDKVCPKKKRRTKIKANPWYSKTLKALSEKVKKAYKNSKRLLGISKKKRLKICSSFMYCLH